MKKTIALAALMLITLAACSPESPRVKVQNQNSQVVDVAIKPPSGSTININDVGGGNETSYIEVPVSNYEVDVNVENVTPNVTTHFRAEDDGSYTIVVSNSTPAAVNVR
jgi:ABC-type proline/glycine betaine transport system substrate-binding protein